MNKTLSIIIPTYNMEKYLRKCLDSLVVSAENMERLEVLVVNDGSRDSSSLIAHEYESRYPLTFRVIDKDNGNYGSCINRGLKEATGKYVKVLDADDYFDNNTFNAFINYLNKVDVDMIVSDTKWIDDNDNVIFQESFNLPSDFLGDLSKLPKESISKITHHCITYRLNIFKEIDYFQIEGISYTDDQWIFSPIVMVKSISYFHFVLYHYLRGRKGQTFDVNVMKKNIDAKIKVIDTMMDDYIKYKTTSAEVERYLYLKLYARTHSFFIIYLIIAYSKLNSEKMKEFDLLIKTKVPKLYQELAGVKGRSGFFFIRAWRKKYNPNIMGLRLMRAKFWLLNMIKPTYQ